MKNSFLIFKYLLWKDLILELRSKDFIISVLIFSILTITVFSQAINLTTMNPNEIGPAILWVSVAFSAAIGIPKIYAKEKEENTIESLLVTPINRDLIFLAKSTSIFILLIFCEIIIFSLSIVLFNIQLFNPIIILISVINNISCYNLDKVNREKDIHIYKMLGITDGRIKLILFSKNLLLNLSGLILGSLISFILLKVINNYNFISLPSEIYFTDTLPIMFDFKFYLYPSSIMLLMSLGYLFLSMIKLEKNE